MSKLWSRAAASTLLACLSASCGGDTSSGGKDAGTAGAPAAGAPAGGASAGGASAGGAGGAPATGGRPGTGGLDCSGAGCAMPPLCSEGCREPCGCCPCTEGEVISLPGGGGKVCRGGCYELSSSKDAGSASCSYEGATYPVGATFYATDGCNVCSCGARGLVSCSKRACPPCDPNMDDHHRSYIGKSPAECMTIRYKCGPNTTAFSNSCGCGCEQPATCPEFYDCEPSPGTPPCDTQALKMQCPYSGFAF